MTLMKLYIEATALSIKKQNKKSQVMLSVLGLQSSKGLSNLDFNEIIHLSRSIVKQIKSEISANDEEKLNISQEVNSVWLKHYSV